MLRDIIFTLIMVFAVTLVSSCESDYTPKPKGYFRIELPEKEYTQWNDRKCPFQFEVPVYSAMVAYRDSISEPCWKYLRMPGFNAELFLSYKSVDGNLLSFIEDTRQLAYKHAVKADAIDEVFVQVPSQKVYGIVYDIGGSAASSIQFFITDSTNHFLRGALYFNARPQPDSLAPVIEFVRSDIMQLIKSTQWN